MTNTPLLPKRTFTDKQKARVRLLIKALRSGEYRQTCGALRNDELTMHCAEGVACDVYRRFAKKGKWVGPHYFQDGAGRMEGAEMPAGVKIWFGFGTREEIDDADESVIGLIPLNEDSPEDTTPKMSFKEIADVLEEMIR